MKKFLELVEQKGTVVFTFGRFNPPTTGHEKLIQKVASVAGSNPFRIYPSYSQNQKKDPLPFALKIAYMRKMFSKYARNIVADKDARTAINIAVKLYDEGFKDLIMVAGSDRVKEFQTLLSTYNGVGGKRHGFYKFDTIDVVSAGERDPDAEGVTGMSASKMRAAASMGDFESFSQGLPSSFRDGKKLYLDVRKYMGIREERDMGEMTDFESLRDMYLTGKIWNIDDLIEANGVEGKIIRKGTNYVAFNDRDGKVHKAWLHEIVVEQKKITKVKQAKGEVGDVKGTQPAKYYAKGAGGKGMSKSTAVSRARFFAKGGDKPDDDPDSYKPAPGDKGKKTKPSQYTKKFKQMYGENENEMDERALTKSQQDRLDDLEAFLGHLQRLRTPRTAEIEATKKKIKKLKSEFDPDSIDESWSIDEMTGINVPELIKTTIHRFTHPKGYKDIITKYAERVKQTTGQPSNGAILSDIARQFGFDRVKPIQMYVNKLVKKGRLPQELAAEYEGKDMEEDFQLDEKIAGLVKKSKQTGVPYGILKKSYDRGMAAWKTGHRPGTTPQQWAFARVNSMLTGGKADPDLQGKVRAAKKAHKAKKKKEEFDLSENGFVVGKIKMPKMKGGAKLQSKTNFDFRLFDPEDSPGSDKANDEMNREIVKASKMKDKETAMAHMNKIQRKHSKHGATDTEPREVIAQVLNRVFGESFEIDEKYDSDKFFSGKGTPEQRLQLLKLQNKALRVLGGSPKQKEIRKEIDALRKKMGMEVSEELELDIQTWYESVDTRIKYQLDHGDDWWWRMNEVHDKMLEKLGLDEGCSIDDEVTPRKTLTIKEFALRNAWGEIDEAAEYDGRPVKLNNPTRGDVKKYKVYVKNDKGNVVKVEFGDPNMEIKRDDPARRKSFRARHNCDNPGPKYKARFWSCKFWEKGKSVTDLMKG